MYKFINLAVPYFAFSALYILVNGLTSKANTNFSMLDILFLWRTPIAQYWYVYALFLLLMIYTVLSNACSDLIATALLVILAYARTLIPNINFAIFGICLGHSLCFGIGVCLRDIQILNRKKNLQVLIGAHLITTAMIFGLRLDGLPLCKDVMRIVGIITSVSLIGSITKNETVQMFLLFINKWCFPIYLLHTIFTAATRILLTKVFIHNFYIHTLLGMIMGLAFPIIIGWVCSKTVILNFFFFPTRTMNQMKRLKVEKRKE